MKKFLSLLIFMCSFNALASKQLKVAVIDTGLSLDYMKSTPLCRGEHRDLTGEGFNDVHGHGTNVTGLIVNNAKSQNYCIVLIKAYAFKEQHGKAHLTEALEYAYQIKANIINLSGGGLNPIESERKIIQKILDAKITLVTAAGNDRLNLDIDCRYYPACYDNRIYVIGSTGGYSNYGKYVDTIYDGNNKTAFGQTLSGTSQSTAIFTGKLLKNIDLLQKRK